MTDAAPFADYTAQLKAIACAARAVRPLVLKLLADYPYTRTAAMACLVDLNECAKFATRELPAEICSDCPGAECTRCSGYGFLRRADLDEEAATVKQEAVLAKRGHHGTTRKRAGQLMDAIVVGEKWKGAEAEKVKERKAMWARMQARERKG